MSLMHFIRILQTRYTELSCEHRAALQFIFSSLINLMTDRKLIATIFDE